MEPHNLQAPRIALLIDFDNVILGVEEPPGFDIELVVNALRSRGVVVLGRAYGDWYRHHRHRRKLMDHGIELVETPAFGPIIKNSADIRIALDGFEIGMTQHHITEICLVSGDSDFLPLIKRLQYLGKTVSVISGVKFTSDLVRRNCNEFISYENLLADSVGATEDATVLEGAFALLVRTINTLHDRGMEVRSSTVKQMMIQLNPVFSERTFGCAQFKQFLDKACRAGKIKLGTRDPNSGEYNVLLPGDMSEDSGEDNGETTAPALEETEKATRPSRRTRGRRVQNADEDLTLEPVSSEEDAATESETAQAPASTPEAEILRENVSREASAREALRQGRLRSSGRTWKGKAITTRSVLQGAVNGAAQIGSTPESVAESTPEATSVAAAPEAVPEIAALSSANETEKSAEKAAEELVEQDGGVVADTQIEATPAEAEEKPKRTPRHRRKAPAAKTNEAESNEVASGEPQSDEVKPAPKAASKSATKKSRSRKSTAKVSDEAASTPAVEAVAQEAVESSSDTEPKEEEKKAAKKPTRRRTPRKKAEDA